MRLVKSEVGLILSDRTIRRYNHVKNLKWGKPRVHPLLSALHEKKRLAFAKKHKLTNFDNWIFSDEKMFRVGAAPVGQRYRKGDRPAVGKNPWSGQVHVWFAISNKFKFQPHIIEGTLTGESFIELMKKVRPTHGFGDTVFMLDGAPAHRSVAAKKWMDKKIPNRTRDWPANSPDCNPIENLWAIINRRVHMREPKSKAELIAAVEDELHKVKPSLVRSLIASMGRRLRAVIAANGGHTKY